MSLSTIELDTSSPIDVNLAINTLGGEPQIFYMMLGNLEGMSLNQTMRDLVQNYNNKDYKEMMN